MSIGKKLMHAVQKEMAMRMPFPYPAQTSESLPRGGTIHASAEIADNDRFSHMANEIRVAVDRPPSRGVRKIQPQERAQQFVQRATYLEEALQFVESDVGGTAIVRSTPESMAGRGAAYYEARVTNTDLTLRRYRSRGTGGEREQLPFFLTDDTLSRLVDDAASVLGKKQGEAGTIPQRPTLKES